MLIDQCAGQVHLRLAGAKPDWVVASIVTGAAIGTDPWLPGVIRNGPLVGLVYEPIVPGERPKVSSGTMAKLIVSRRARTRLQCCPGRGG